MDKLLIKGGKRLQGKIKVDGAKNAALPLMAASILVRGDVALTNVPDLLDVRVMSSLLRELGASVTYNAKKLVLNTDSLNSYKAPYELVRKMNASFDVAGPLLARFRRAEVSLPGGCVLGTRAVNFHLEGFQALGANVELEHGYVKAEASALKGTTFFIGRSSVGATKNILMAACGAEGTTVLENAAREPEITDIANFLNSCGAEISGLGTSRLVIKGGIELRSNAPYEIIPDRIAGGTYLLAGAVTGGEVTVTGISSEFLEAFLLKLEEANLEVTRADNEITVKNRGIIKSVKEIITSPYPAFPTDLHPPFSALLTLANGTSIIRETIFDSRFNYVAELNRMGANIEVVNGAVIIKGVEKLNDAPVFAHDIRAGGALVLAGLAAEGLTEITGVPYIDRGYEKIEEKLSSLGADVKRVKENS